MSLKFRIKKDRDRGYLYVHASGVHMPETCFGLSYPGALRAARIMLSVARTAQGRKPDDAESASYALAMHLLSLPLEAELSFNP